MSVKTEDTLDELCVNTIRVISAALPQQANSGHPGAPIGCAPMAHALYGKIMRFAPAFPEWPARDRFVLSNGHACALQYTMLHLLGFPGLESIETLKQFRQLGSVVPGHPERGLTSGVEVCSGPLGQGIAQGVGLTMAAEMLTAEFDRPGYPLFEDTYTYVIVGDGCLQEGVAAEACSLAGHLKLGRLIVFYDSNGISIDGSVELSFTENTQRRFESLGWQVLHVADGDRDNEGILKAVEQARACTDKPSIIICKTTIGYGTKLAGSEKTHGSPLGAAALTDLRAKFNIEPFDDMWALPDAVKDWYKRRQIESNDKYQAWAAMFNRYAVEYPKEAAELKLRLAGELPANLAEKLPVFQPTDKPEATRSLSGKVLNAVSAIVPGIVGGSADLKGSNSCGLSGAVTFTETTRGGQYIHFGVREHGMTAIGNGIVAFGAHRCFVATFLNFFTYAWGAVRLSALSHLPLLCIATHDSIDLGEDGPTHQPIEVAALCRATPNLIYIRPADGNEVSGAYEAWLRSKGTPVVVALCRSAVPHLANTAREKTLKGAYILHDFKNNGKPKVLVASCGTELNLCVTAANEIEEARDVRVVSFPSWELFEAQDEAYRRLVIPLDVPVRLYVEAACALGSEKYFNRRIDMTNHFGVSAPGPQAMAHFGFTVDNIKKSLL